MKKAYTKPQIMFEDFTLTTNIANNCEVQINTQSSGTCGLDFGPYVVFLDTMVNICTGDGIVKSEGGDGQYNELCYHVPQGSENLFNS